VDEPEGVVADDKLLLRIEEAAKRLGIGRSLMYRLVLSGQVQSVPLGRLRRIPAEALREYVERLRVEASGKSPAGVADHGHAEPEPSIIDLSRR
jgi:excisionase family DNA binding protein